MCDLTKPLVACTLGDFIEALSFLRERKEPELSCKHIDLPFPRGIKGIRQIFNCSDYAARQILKSGVIEKAIYRIGSRTFVTDPQMAKDLYQSNKTN